MVHFAAGPPYPLGCRPLLKPKLWGGRWLEEVLGKPLPAGQRIGESWEVADLPEGVSGVTNGPLAGRTLREAVETWGEALTGPETYQGRFPLLVKFIHAADDLSIQVHPGEGDCARYFPHEHGKDETWLILHAEPHGAILHGCVPGTTLAEFDRHLAAGTVARCLRRQPVRAGDAIRIAPGTVHAVCRGVLLLEIQQPSDSTFRIDDYGRLDEQGRPRPLHLAEARRVIRFGPDEPVLLSPEAVPTAWGRRERIVETAAYRIERLQVSGATHWAFGGDSPAVLVLVSGALSLRWTGGALPVRRGDTVIVPAAVRTLRIEAGPPESCVVVSTLGRQPPVEIMR